MSSLTYKNRQFLLAGSPFHIFSGAIHYFRVVPEYWADRLQKAKACGLNTIETYVPWNLHEPQPGVFKADGILDIRKYIRVASDLGFKVILRPGPYICSEWDFGGLPSWLLADPSMKVRSEHPGYKHAAQRYLTWILGLVEDLQFCKGGPIIAVQLENEFGSYSDDLDHLLFIKHVTEQAGITELLVTSDNPWGANPNLHIQGVVPTANFQTVDEGKAIVDIIEKTDQSLPLMAMEFWSGWFDHWGSRHHERSVDILEASLQFLLDRKASVNFYMYHGGTNFGFMAGANMTDGVYKPDVTSYDYDAPLSEDGGMTNKYFKIHAMIKEFLSKNCGEMLPDIDTALKMSKNRIQSKREFRIHEVLSWSSMIGLGKKVTSQFNPVPMEMVTYPDGQVQSYGYVVYRKRIALSDPSELVLPPYVKDRATVLVDGHSVAVFDLTTRDRMSVILDASVHTGAGQEDGVVLDIVVENLGRVNYTEKANPDVLNQQRKGLQGEMILGGNPINDWTVIALDFTDDFLSGVMESDAWKAPKAAESIGPVSASTPNNHTTTTTTAATTNTTIPATSTTANTTTYSPSLYRSQFEISDQPADCFVRLDGFTKGIVIVNGFNLGRYWNVGPQKSLYLPAPVLKQGQNWILIFEEQKADAVISLDSEPQLM